MTASCQDPSLVPCDLRLLLVGDLAPGNIYDRQGRVQIASGVELTSEYLRMLTALEEMAGGIYVRPDSPAASDLNDAITPQQVVEDLAKQNTGPREENLRLHPRHAWKIPLRLELVEKTYESSARRTIEVTAHNISLGGFGFSYGQYIHPGTIVNTIFETLDRRPILVGVVRHCTVMGGMQHFVGVEFVENSS